MDTEANFGLRARAVLGRLRLANWGAHRVPAARCWRNEFTKSRTVDKLRRDLLSARASNPGWPVFRVEAHPFLCPQAVNAIDPPIAV